MSILIDADARDRTSTDTTSYKIASAYKPIDLRTVQLVELTDECIEKIVRKIAEAKPVVRGEWKRTPTGQPYCSVCGDFPWEHKSSTRSYCSECGAYMEQN